MAAVLYEALSGRSQDESETEMISQGSRRFQRFPDVRVAYGWGETHDVSRVPHFQDINKRKSMAKEKLCE